MPVSTTAHIQIDDRGVAWIDGTNTKVLEVALDMTAHGWSPEEIHFQHAQAEVYRLASRCGLPEAEKRLVADSGRLFPNIDALPRAVLDCWYRSKESKEWDELEAVAKRAQSIPDLRSEPLGHLLLARTWLA